MTNSDWPAAPSSVFGDLRVVDFTHYIAGPLATMILADAGAEVIKIEKPAGDDQRHFAPLDSRLDGEGASFLWANRNKRSVTLDLRTPRGQSIARALVDSADVVVENFSTGVMERYGLDYATVAKDREDLIYCSISAFGRTGPFAQRLGFDTIMQAESGIMSMTGHPHQDGVKAGPPIVDISTGLIAGNAILIALASRARTGRGQHIDVQLYGAALMMTGFVVSEHLFSGKVPGRHGNGSSNSVPSGVFRTSDHPIFITCTNTALFRKLFSDVLGRHDMAQDQTLQGPGGRIDHREAISQVLQEALEKKPRDVWLRELHEAGVPAGAVNTLPQALQSDEARALNLVTQLPHPSAGHVPNLSLPMHFSGVALVPPRAAPRLGADTESVLSEVLGLDRETIDAARAEGAFG